MRVSKIWKFIGAGIVIGAIAIGGVACSSSSAQAPAATPQAATNLILSSDMVIGSGGTPAPATACVLTSVFKPGQIVVFRIRVYDPVTGQQMDDKALSSVTVSLPDGQTFSAKYSGHPANTPVDHFWAVSWTIPSNYPSGTISYTATAKATDGRTGTFDNFNVQPSLLTIAQ